MHEDPTRRMDAQGGGEPPGRRPHGNMRLVVAGLIAVIVGLLVAIVVLAGEDGGEDATAPTITEPAPTEPTQPETTEQPEPAPSETEPESPTDTTPETTPTTPETDPEAAPETPSAPEQDGGTGGVEAP